MGGAGIVPQMTTHSRVAASVITDAEMAKAEHQLLEAFVAWRNRPPKERRKGVQLEYDAFRAGATWATREARLALEAIP